MKISIALGTDEKYIRQSYILIKSIMDVSKVSLEYVFYVLLDESVSVASRELLYSCKKIYPNCCMKLLPIDERIGHADVHISHITKATYFRLLLPDLLEEDKCLYLDSDIIVCRDLAEIFDISIEQYEVAGVKAPGYHCFPDQGKKYMGQTRLPAMKQYINAGVLLLNLKLMRENRFTQRAIQLIDRYFPTQDQDIINLLCYGKIKHLPLKYNVPASYLKSEKEALEIVFGHEELEEGKQHPCIIHFCSHEKPWDWLTVPFAGKWWEVCRKTEFFAGFLEENRMAFYYYGVICHQPLWKYEAFTPEWCRELERFPKVYVYGAGEIGKKVIRKLHKKGISVAAALVSTQEGKDQEAEGVPVEQFSSRISREACIILGVSGRYKREIRDKLFEENYFNIFTG